MLRDCPWSDILSDSSPEGLELLFDYTERAEEHPKWEGRPDSLAERQGAALIAAQSALPYLPNTELTRQLAVVLSGTEPATQSLYEELDIAAITPTPAAPSQQRAWQAARDAVGFALRGSRDPERSRSPAAAYNTDESIRCCLREAAELS
ncbi:MAG: hypothetical protein OIF57_06610 [Marinobacterium sp.]|nr:hypothetical protein [Marinobacterium sp.]